MGFRKTAFGAANPSVDKSSPWHTPPHPRSSPVASSPGVFDSEKPYFTPWHLLHIQPLHDSQRVVLIQLSESWNRQEGQQVMWHITHCIIDKLTLFWPPGVLWVEQLSAQSSFTGFRRVRSSLLLLNWSLSCSFCCLSSEPKSTRLQRSARLPVKSTRASDTCPAHSRSYEPWSLWRSKGQWRGFQTFLNRSFWLSLQSWIFTIIACAHTPLCATHLAATFMNRKSIGEAYRTIQHLNDDLKWIPKKGAQNTIQSGSTCFLTWKVDNTIGSLSVPAWAEWWREGILIHLQNI